MESTSIIGFEMTGSPRQTKPQRLQDGEQDDEDVWMERFGGKRGEKK